MCVDISLFWGCTCYSEWVRGGTWRTKWRLSGTVIFFPLFFLYNSTPSCFVFLVKKYLIHYHSFHLIFMLVLKFLTLINHVKHELWCVHSTPLFLRCLNSLGRVWWEPCMGTTRGLRPPTSRNFLDIMWLEMVICAVIHFQFYSKCASYNCVKWEFAL